jgi:hypothetical protein
VVPHIYLGREKLKIKAEHTSAVTVTKIIAPIIFSAYILKLKMARSIFSLIEHTVIKKRKITVIVTSETIS